MLKWLASKWPKHDIVKVVDGEKVLYLRRYFLIRCPFFRIFLHHIALPDLDPDPHDHPWSFISIRLRGGYVEELYKDRENFTMEYFRPFSASFRRAEAVHTIPYVEPNTWTLVIAGPQKRHWGFLTRDGWKHWRHYLNYWGPVDMD